MKIRKNISKLLGLSLFMSNFSLYSTMATSNNEIPNRYEILEGEYITIDDSTEGEIKSIEILGNTVQDENNLEDIQSVGDLYVDENGSPILDKDGNEQYKIEIVSTGKNLLNAENEYDVDIRKRFIKAYELKSNTNYTLSLNYLKGENFAVLLSNTYSETLNHDVLYKEVVTDSDGIEITARLTNSVTFNSQNYKYMYVTSWVYDSAGIKVNKLQLEEGEIATEYEPYKEERLTILSPTPLEKVGNVSDRIIYKNGVWGVENNIVTKVLNGNEDFTAYASNTPEYITMAMPIENALSSYKQKIYSDMFICRGDGTVVSQETENIEIHSNGNLYIKALRTKIGNNENEFKNWLKQNNVMFKYITTKPQFISLPHSQQIKLNTFLDKTHVFSQAENGVNPTLKVTVDRLNRMALDAVDESESNSTIDNLNTARNLVNHMNEGELKEQLQQRLNEITNLNDLLLERKNSTSNVDIYIKSENMLSMALSTNNITFEDYSGVDDLEQSSAIKISINSSLPYQLNSYLVSEIQNTDGVKIIDKDRLNIKDSSDIDYKEFITINDKLILKDNCNAGNDLSHYIDLKLNGGEAYPADIYKTVIKFEAEQK